MEGSVARKSRIGSFQSGVSWRSLVVMRARAFLVILIFFCRLGWGAADNREFTLVTYNVENLFDVDGLSAYSDYQSENYGPREMLLKLQGIVRVLGTVSSSWGGRQRTGPDVIVFNEIEIDQTPESRVEDLGAWLDAHAGKSVESLLGGESLDEGLRGLPANVWLAKALEDGGLGRYEVAETDEGPGVYEDGRPIGVRNVIFSRFPIKDIRTHRTLNARAILEVRIDVEGYPLIVFGNHWKSGAGDLAAESIRIENARTLRGRLDEIFAENPMADVVVAGDLNSHYNQGRRYREMRRTGIEDVLGSQGNEIALRGQERDLYNLWFEVPSDKRGSDIYQNEWGTLMHIIVSRGLYDRMGIQYVDNSFAVLSIPELNMDDFGRPKRWDFLVGGYSDHFPLLARFRVAEQVENPRWMALSRPSRGEMSQEPRRVNFALVDILKNVRDASKLPKGTDLQDGSFNGLVFKVQAPARVDRRGVVLVEVCGKEFELYSSDDEIRRELKARVEQKGELRFYGELGTFRKRWQFLIHGREWLIPRM